MGTRKLSYAARAEIAATRATQPQMRELTRKALAPRFRLSEHALSCQQMQLLTGRRPTSVTAVSSVASLADELRALLRGER